MCLLPSLALCEISKASADAVGMKLAAVLTGEKEIETLVYSVDLSAHPKDEAGLKFDAKILKREVQSQIATIQSELKKLGFDSNTIRYIDAEKVNDCWILHYNFGLDADVRFFSALSVNDAAVAPDGRLRRPLVWSMRLNNEKSR